MGIHPEHSAVGRAGHSLARYMPYSHSKARTKSHRRGPDSLLGLLGLLGGVHQVGLEARAQHTLAKLDNR